MDTLDARDAIIVFGPRSGATPARMLRGNRQRPGVVPYYTLALGIVTTGTSP